MSGAPDSTIGGSSHLVSVHKVTSATAVVGMRWRG
jgi:hypothetical protein